MSRIIITFLIIILGITSSYSQRHPCANEIDSLIKIGDAILYNHTDSSFNYIQEASQIANQCADSLGIIKSKTYLGLYHYLKNNYDLATQYYFDALSICERNNYTLYEGTLNNNLGTLYFDIEEYQKSKGYYEKALETMTILKDTSWIARICGNLAGVYFMNKEYDKSIKTLNSSIDLAIQVGNYIAVGGALGNLAMVHMTLNDDFAAFAAFDRAANLLDSLGDKRGVCLVLENKAKALTDQNKLLLAKLTYKKALEKATEIAHKETIMKSYKGLASIEEKSGNLRLALDYQKKYTQWKDSLLNDGKIKSIQELNEKYQTEQKEKEIAFLTTETELKTALVEEKQKERNYIALLAVLFLVVILLVVIQLKQKQKLNAELRSKNVVIKDALDEREILVKEVHHRVKNNLQIVSSMLNIQASSLDNGKVKEALLVSRKRVQSMSIIHQKLYKTDKIGQINIKEYIEYLLSEVESFYDFDENVEVELMTQIEECELNIDITVPLGLIITELVSNAYKHAFKDQSKGEIEIKLSYKENQCHLIVSDNGSGIENYDFDKSQSFGIKLIKSLAKSLSTEPSWESENGTKVILKFTV